MKIHRGAPKLARAFFAALVGLMIAAGSAPARQGDGPESAPPPQQPRVIQVKILGMSCPFCAYGVEQKLKKLDGVKELKIELESGVATLMMKEGADIPNEKLERTVDDAGFEAAAIVRSFDSEHEDWNPERLPTTGKPDTSPAGGRR